MYAFVQEKLWWRINGINFLRENAIRCEDYDRAAHVLKIAWRFNMQPSIKNSVSDFITVHHSFVCPDVVLRDNITLYYIDMNKAVFIQTDEHVRIWSKAVEVFIPRCNITMPQMSLSYMQVL